jgi:hypothetical protein
MSKNCGLEVKESVVGGIDVLVPIDSFAFGGVVGRRDRILFWLEVGWTY